METAKRSILCPACGARLTMSATATAPRIRCVKCDTVFPAAMAATPPKTLPPPSSLPRAGWYPNPEGPGQRYWDGRVWAPAVAPTPPQVRMSSPVKGLFIVGAVILAGGCVAAMVRTNSDDKHPKSGATSDTVSIAPDVTISRFDLKDAAFMATIIQEGIPVVDREALLDTAHGVCPYLEIRGNNTPSLLAELMREQPSLTAAQVGRFARAAMESFCPDKVPG
ncbi:hypothetical protein MHPYR_70176 [uncultured Mycobacterium sp.]|uniref:DUF2510 domain-containing protein n=1 Tax=uncultured Mycobacterium sp. TaxID=171292 RepID=A0A1Y5PKS8_9MYCO|nr:hypothetical protein MHPYR_70176 [uncultured Mycobacterium sp.]